jgi:hypothetical protein
MENAEPFEAAEAGSAEFRFSETLRLFALRGARPIMMRDVQRK